MKKMTGESTNITEENLSAMRQLFPEAFEEGKIDFDVLRQLLGDYVDDEEERYSFKWNGKGRALRLSQTPSTGTLRPCKEESVDWDTTQNLYIEGDNLEVLKLLQKSYHGRVKMIYIDPPYNTGSDFVYKDDFRDNVENYKRITGQVDGEGHWISANKENRESSGRFHTDWLNMMYPRLRLARNLLADDGVIFISIDDNEQDNLKKICDEVFGADNFITLLKWKRKKQPSFLSKHVALMMEYILVFAKQAQCLEKLSIEATSDATKKVINISNQESERLFKAGVEVKSIANGIIPSGVYTIKTMTIEYKNDIIVKNGKTENEVKVVAKFLNTQDKIDEFTEQGLLFITANNGLRRYVSEEEKNKEKSITDLLLDWGDNQDSEKEQKDLLEAKYFDYMKPTLLLKNLTQSITDKNSFVLDFFSGSATTAHSVMQMNAEDGGNRRFIMVQLPEPTPEKSEAAKAGYVNICEIGKERIRRAGEKVKAECADTERAAALDVGFKVFKLDSSNLQKWQPQPEDLMASLEASMDNFLPDRTELDIVYEIALKLGLELSYEVEERETNGHTIYVIGAGALMICLDSQISMNTAEALLRLHEEYEPETWQVVFRDTGFLSDQEKTNIKETLKSAGLDEDAFISI